MDDRNRRIDFYCLRHSFITMLSRSAAHPKIVQAMARHSSFALTYDRYSHLRSDDKAKAVQELPDLSPRDDLQTGAAESTGTNGAISEADYLPLGLPSKGAIPAYSVALGDTKPNGASEVANSSNPASEHHSGRSKPKKGDLAHVVSGSGEGTRTPSTLFSRPKWRCSSVG